MNFICTTTLFFTILSAITCVTAYPSPQSVELHYGTRLSASGITSNVVYSAVEDVRFCFAVVLETAQKYTSAKKKLDKIERSLVGHCDGMKDRTKQSKAMKLFFKVAAKVPLGAIKKIGQVLDRGVGTVIDKFQPPTDKLCYKILKIRALTDPFDESKKGKIFNKIAKVLGKGEKWLGRVDKVLSTWESIFEDSDLDEKQVCPNLFSTNEYLSEMNESCRTISKPFVEFVNLLENFIGKLEKKILKPVNKVVNAVEKVFEGEFGKIVGVFDKLSKVKVKLPSGKLKERGFGKVPTCCPSNRKKYGLLCSKKCDDWEEVGDLCVKKCPKGYKTYAFLCKKKNNLFKWKKRSVFGRNPRAPASFGNEGCDCSGDGREYLEAGLCYRKCGKDSFEDYKLAILNNCMDITLRTYTVEQLASVVKLFDNIDKVPGIGTVKKEAEGLVDKILNPIEKLVKSVFGFSLPGISSITNVDISLPFPEIPEAKLNSIDKILGTTLAIDFSLLTGECT